MPNFSYNINIPDAPNNPSNDQPKMKINTNSIDSIIGVDHFSFGTGKDGWHQQVTLPISLVIPTITAGQGSLYTKTATTATAHTESTLFYSPDTTENQYQLTRTISTNFTNFSTNNAYGTPPAGFTQTGGWTFLPGGMLVQYGFFGKTGATGSSGQIQFPQAWTTSNFSIQMLLFRNSGNQSIALDSTIPPTTTTFNFLTSSSGSDGISWLAVGV